MKSAFILIFFLFPTLAFAQGNGAVGGGGIVICPDPKTPGRFLAYPHEIYEGMRSYHFSRIYQKTATELNRFLHSRLIPSRHEKLFQKVSAEYDALIEKGRTINLRKNSGDTQPLEEIEYPLTPDLLYESQGKQPETLLENGCILRNGVWFYFGRSVEFDSNLVANLVHFDQDLVIMRWHEIMYRISRILHDARTSEKTRNLMVMATADEMIEASHFSWFSKKRRINLACYQTSFDDFWDNQNDWSKNLDELHNSEKTIKMPLSDQTKPEKY